jgi:hypothetical protein
MDEYNQKRIKLIGLFTVAQQLTEQQEQIVRAAAATAGEKLDDTGYGLASDYAYGFESMSPIVAAEKYLAALAANPRYTIEGADK